MRLLAQRQRDVKGALYVNFLCIACTALYISPRCSFFYVSCEASHKQNSYQQKKPDNYLLTKVFKLASLKRYKTWKRFSFITDSLSFWITGCALLVADTIPLPTCAREHHGRKWFLSKGSYSLTSTPLLQNISWCKKWRRPEAGKIHDGKPFYKLCVLVCLGGFSNLL